MLPFSNRKDQKVGDQNTSTTAENFANSGGTFQPSTPMKSQGKSIPQFHSNSKRSPNVVMELDVVNDSNVSQSCDFSESSFGSSTPKKGLQASVLKSRSNSKRSEAVMVEDVLSLNGDQSHCSGEGNDSLSSKKQRDRGVSCTSQKILFLITL